MEITSEHIKQLRDQTGISVMQCKKALEEAGGDMEKAIIILKKKRSEAADKKSDRELGAGAIGSYVHNSEVAAMVVLACETDFVSKNTEFAALAREVAMQVAATNPSYISKEQVPEEVLQKAREVFAVEVVGKPADMQEKILEGKMAAYFKEQILLEQAFIKNPDTTIRDLISGAVQKFGENITVAQISRLSVK